MRRADCRSFRLDNPCGGGLEPRQDLARGPLCRSSCRGGRCNRAGRCLANHSRRCRSGHAEALVFHGRRPARLAMDRGRQPEHCQLARRFGAAEFMVATNDRRSVRECTRPNCGWLFIDTSRGGLKRWCSDESCGTHTRVGAACPRRHRPEPQRGRGVKREGSLEFSQAAYPILALGEPNLAYCVESRVALSAGAFP